MPVKTLTEKNRITKK
jgi:hypothetical protein